MEIIGLLLLSVLILKLRNARREIRRLKAALSQKALGGDEAVAESGDKAAEVSFRDLKKLIFLRLYLKRLRREGEIEDARYIELTERLDSVWSEQLGKAGVTPDTRLWREAAWDVFVAQQADVMDQPPWREAEEPSLPPVGQEVSQPETPPPEPVAQPVVASGPVPMSRTMGSVTATVPGETQGPPIAAEKKPAQTGSTSSADESGRYAWEASQPSALERALQVVSGWPKAIAPFLVQNIGWFIGGFCFVAGTVFLVSYTEGYVNALTIAACLLTYTQLLLWAGYLLRRRRPDLQTSSSVLMAIGMLLIPLNLTACVQLILAGLDSGALTAVAILVAALVLAASYFSAALTSGMMDRSLQGAHAKIFLLLGIPQFAAPVIIALPSWPFLGLFHLALLGLMGYGLLRFSRDWIQSIFVDQRKIAYYASGTLVYSALVSWVYLSLAYPSELPQGYFSPFLMALCGLLFYVDASVKQWTKKYPFLSRFTFAIYGFSILALALSFDAPVARIITLALGIGIYGLVVWKYLTLPPLYLFLGCIGWLYAMLVLTHFPATLHLLLSLPGLAGLFALQRWALGRGSQAVARISLTILAVSVMTLTAWSLFPARPGLVALITGLTATFLLFQIWRVAPAAFAAEGLFSEADESVSHDPRIMPWLYVVPLMAGVAMAYAPLWSGLGWSNQLAFGWLLLALLWTRSGLLFYQQHSVTIAEVLLNSALLSVLGALVIVLSLLTAGLTEHRSVPVLLGLMGGIALWLSLALRIRWLFYGVLAAWGAMGFILKRTYFPAPSSGLGIMVLALSLWLLLWRIEREPKALLALQREQEAIRDANTPPLTLLWWLPVVRPSPSA